MIINNSVRKSRRKKYILSFILSLIIVIGAVVAYLYFKPTTVEQVVNQLQFDSSVTETEKESIRQAIRNQSKTYGGAINVGVNTAFEAIDSLVLSAYIPVTNIYSTRQIVTKEDLKNTVIYVTAEMEDTVRFAIAELIETTPEKLVTIESVDLLKDTDIAFIPVGQLSQSIKLLTLEDAYYMDSFQKGAVFRRAVFTGNDTTSLSDLNLNNLPTKDTVMKVNMTGVTALTRIMMTKLKQVGDPLYFSAKIGDFLADADITHVSNEVSFKEDCQISYTVFCSPPEMIEVLKDSGVDLVELTGNHNNDTGNKYNTETINLYSSLGWNVVGGGLNTAEAAKPFVTEQKQSKITFLAYNYPDSPSGNAIAGVSTAGANSFDFDRITSDIAVAKQQSNFVIVNVQFWECYAYPDGYVELPSCYRPIPNQKEVFRKIIDLGADMVVGSSAHQPQTYELYNGKPIYYGLGNLYFDQTQWPGTEKGIILTHYFYNNNLLQTKLSPTIFDGDLQTRLMINDEAVNLLEKLRIARIDSDL